MFDFKHKIKLNTNEIVSLFGEGYFADKSTFWNSHQTTLNNLYERVIKTGFPIFITDLENDTNSIKINNLEDFHKWLQLNQPFNFDRIKSK